MKDFKNNLRLTILFLFMTFQMPGQFRLFFPGGRPVEFEDPRMCAFLLLFAMLIFMMLESLEFLKWNYRYKSQRIPQVLFLIRITVVFFLVFFSKIGLGHPAIVFYVTLLLFYGYYAFSFPISGIFSLLVVIAYIIYEASGLNFDEFGGQNIFLSTYKILIMLIFYFFAYLWDKDRAVNDYNKKLLDELNQSEQNLRVYAQKVGQVVALEERNRLARDIHDSVGHALSVIQIQLSKSEAYFTIDPEESLSGIREAKKSAHDVMQDIRSSLGILKDSQMITDLKQDLARIVQRAESEICHIDYHFTGDEKGCNYAVILAVFRMVQEGVTNIIKHADATRVALNVVFTEDLVQVELSDNGKGFSLDLDGYRSRGHLGLEGLYRRIELVRGQFDIVAAPEKGCTLRARMPRDPVSLIGGADARD